MAATPEENAAAPAGPAPGAPDAARASWFYALYSGHLLTLFGIALSNAFLGLTVLATPFLPSRREPALARARPLLGALVAYVLWLGVAIAGSVDRQASLAALREALTLSTLPLALLAVRDERRLRRLVDALVLVAAGLAVLGLS